MPPLTILFLRAAFSYLLAGFALGAILSVERGVHVAQVIWKLWPLHVEFLVFGFLVQLSMGVAFWILPRFLTGALRGNELPAVAAFCLINAGVLLCGFAPVFGLPLVLGLAGKICQLAAVVCFAVHAWPRVYKSDDICRGESSKTAS